MTQLNTNPFIEIKINNSEDKIIFQKTCNSLDECKIFSTKYCKSKPGWSLIQGALCPIRTNNIKDFSKDLFLPTYLNHTGKKDISFLMSTEKIIFLVLMIFDVFTFPIRLITSPFRAVYNQLSPEEVHPLAQLIRDYNNDQTINESLVTIEYKQIETTFENPIKMNEIKSESCSQKKTSIKETIALITCPNITRLEREVEITTTQYHKIGENWEKKEKMVKKKNESKFDYHNHSGNSTFCTKLFTMDT